MVTPSTPGAPRFDRTSSQALSRMSPRATLSNRAWKRRCGCCLALRYSTRCKARDGSRPSAFAVDLARMRALTDPLPPACASMKQGPFPPAGLCCPAPSGGTTTPSDALVAACHFPASPVIGRHCFPNPQPGATEGLSSSHDNLPTVPRPLRRRVPWHPLQAPRCRPWPSPSEYRLGSLLAACAVILNDAAGFASCCGPVGCPPRTGGGLPPPRPRALTRRRECCYRGPWRLPGPDSHRLAAVSLSLGYVVVPSFRWSSAPELLDAHSSGISRAFGLRS